MKRFFHFTLLTLLLLTACGTAPVVNPPTSTPLPTETPQPTFTPPPTATVTPTATPNATATAVAEATLTAADVINDLEEVLRDSGIPYKDGYLAWKQAEPLKINMTGPDQKVLEIGDELTAGDFILKSDVTWDATGLLLCGATFRSEPDLAKGKQY